MRSLLISLLMMCPLVHIWAQGTTLKWARNEGGLGVDYGRAVAVDPSGSVYTTGHFVGTVDFDPGPNVFNLISAGSSDVYVLKLDANGNFVWAKRIGGTGADISYALSLDNSGNIYYTGNFEATADFDPGPAVSPLSATTTNAPPGFIAKLDATGNFIWAAKFDETRFDGLTVGLDGYLYGAGGFSGTTDFDPGPAVFNLTAAGYTVFNPFLSDAVILKLDLAGNFVWAKAVGGVNQDYASCITVTSTGQVYVMGSLDTNGDLDPGSNVYTINTNGGWDVFFLSLDMAGNFLWAGSMGGRSNDFATGMARDGAGNIYAVGSFYGSGDYDPGLGVFTLTAPSVSGDVWVGKFTSSGSLGWVKNMGGAGEDFGAEIALDAAGNIYTVGGFSGTADFDPGNVAYNISSGGLYDIFISRLDNSGNFVWAKSMGSSANDAAFGIAVDASQNVYTTGYFSNTVDFDPEVGTYSLTAIGAQDAFVQKLSQCLNVTFATISTTVCNSYTLNGYTYNVSGTYMQILTNSTGCDSTLTLNLTIGGSTTGDTITACDAYTWQGQSYNQTGNYTIVLPGADGCDSILKLKLTIKNKSLTTVDTTICGGQGYAGYMTSGTYVDMFAAANGCDSIRTLNLTVKPRSYSNLTVTICEGENYLGYVSTGTYQDTLQAANGCDSVRTLNLLVNPRRYTTSNVSICEGQSYFAGGANQIATGVYRDTLLSQSSCDSIIATNLIVHPKPRPDLGHDRDLCHGTVLLLSPGTFATYQWQDQSTNPTFTANNRGRYWVTITDDHGCFASDTMAVTGLLPVPSDFLKSSDTICQYDNLQLIPSGNYDKYVWSTGLQQPILTVQQAGHYDLTVTDSRGCTGKDSIEIFQRQCHTGFFVPSAFTPNNDGKNDLFQPRLFGNMRFYHLRVYNRWGSLVFQTTNPANGWDGTITGVKQKNGVFVWTCEYQLDGETRKFEKGTITIIH